MASGRPWVSFDVGSARENDGGIVVSNFNEMAEAIIGLSRNPEFRKELGEAGRAQIVAKHDWDGIVDQYERVYETAIGGRTDSAPLELVGPLQTSA
jgi:glycosyltransferase involved in cell wall biosynthesis